MRSHNAHIALAALCLAGAVLLVDVLAPVPWPAVALRSLAGILALVGVTRLLGESGLPAQRYTRYGALGVALTAAAWFLLGAWLYESAALVGLGVLHVVAAGLAWSRERDAALRERGRLITALTASIVSLLAIALLPRDRGYAAHFAPAVPLALAGMAALGATQIARGRTVGLMIAALAGVVSLVLAARVLSVMASTGGAPVFSRAAPVPALTLAIAALFPVSALAVRLPMLSRMVAPKASPMVRGTLSFLTLPLVAAVAFALMR